MDGGLVEQLTLRSSSISGGGDRDRLEAEIGGISGVRDIEVKTGEHAVQITYDPTIVNATSLQAAVERAGFKLDSLPGGRSDAGEAGNFLNSEVTAAERGADVGSPASGGPSLAAGPAGSGGPGTGMGTGTAGTGPGHAGFGPVVVPTSDEGEAEL